MIGEGGVTVARTEGIGALPGFVVPRTLRVDPPLFLKWEKATSNTERGVRLGRAKVRSEKQNPAPV